MKMKKKANICS